MCDPKQIDNSINLNCVYNNTEVLCPHLDMEWKTKGWIQNHVWNMEFEDMSEAEQKEVQNMQVVDTVRFPYFNHNETIGVTYYTGFNTGLSYFDGSPLDGFYLKVKKEILARQNNEPVWTWKEEDGPICLVNCEGRVFNKETDLFYNLTASPLVEDCYKDDPSPGCCHIPESEQLLNYEPRCRPWYLKAWKHPGNVILVTYPSLDNLNLWVSLAKTIDDEDGNPFGVAAIDIDTSFLADVLSVDNQVKDFFLITTGEQLVLYGD